MNKNLLNSEFEKGGDLNCLLISKKRGTYTSLNLILFVFLCAFANIESSKAQCVAIGDHIQGGIVFYVDSTGQSGLLAAPNDLANAAWGCNGTEIIGAYGRTIGTGLTNSNNIVNQCTTGSVAAQLCRSLSLGGYNDWYLPSLDEMSILYSQKIAVGGFLNNAYWTSTQDLPSYALAVNINSGIVMNWFNKTWGFGVRPIRYFTKACVGPASSLHMDGVKDYINLTNSNTLKPNTGLTVELWLYKSNWSSLPANKTIVGNTQNGGYSLQLDGPNLKSWIYRNNAYSIASTNISNLKPGWHHFAMTYDGQNNKLYVDCVLKSTINSGSVLPIQYSIFNTSTLVGAESSETNIPELNQYCSGRYDELRFWNYARNSNALCQRKNCELSPSENGLLAYYKFNQGIDASLNSAINTSTDASLNNITGFLNNFNLNGNISNWLAPGAVGTGIICKDECSSCQDTSKYTTTLVVNTGYSESTSNALPVGAQDNRWKIIDSPPWATASPCFMANTLKPSAWTIQEINPWYAAMPKSRWISPCTTNASLPNNAIPMAPFTFEYDFCLCENDSITFDMHAFADDYLRVYVDERLYTFAEIVNGTPGVHYFSKMFLNAGKHHLRAELRNLGTLIMGFNLAGTISGKHLLKYGDCTAATTTLSPISAGNDKSINIGNSTNLTVTGCSGNLQWYKLNDNVSTLIPGATNPTLNVNPSLSTCYYVSCCLVNSCCVYDTVCVTVVTDTINCIGNIVENGGFNQGFAGINGGDLDQGATISNWHTGIGSPQVFNGPGCVDNGFIFMWGNKEISESFEQVLTTPFKEGHAYKIRYCAAKSNINKPFADPFVRFLFRASNNLLTDNSTSGDLSVISGNTNDMNISSNSWTTYNTSCWVANKDYGRLTVSIQTNKNIDNGDYVSYGTIDNICITECPCDVVAYAGMDTSVCNGTTVTLKGNTYSGARYEWRKLGTNTILGTQKNLNVNPSLTTCYVLKVISTEGCYRLDTVCVTILKSPVRPGRIFGNGYAVPGSILTYSVNLDSNATWYTWTWPPTWTGTVNHNSINVTAGTLNGNISVNAVNGCGLSVPTSLSVNLVPLVIPTSEIRNEDCGKTDFSLFSARQMNTYTVLNKVVGATDYETEFSSNSNFATIAGSTKQGNRTLIFANISGLAWNQIYFVRSRAWFGSIQGPWGNVCQIGFIQNPVIVGVPNASLDPHSCGRKNVSVNNSLLANITPGANSYTFNFYNDSLLTNLYSSITYRGRNVSIANLVPGLLTCTKYWVTVQAIIGNISGSSSIACEIEMACPPARGNNGEFGLMVYPNPSKDVFNVIVNSNYMEPIQVKLLDALGRIILSQQIQTNTPLLLGENLPAGYYLLEATNLNGIKAVSKMIKNK